MAFDTSNRLLPIGAGRYRTRSGSTARIYEIARYGQESVAVGALFSGDEFISAEHWHLDGTYDRARSTGMDIVGRAG